MALAAGDTATAARLGSQVRELGRDLGVTDLEMLGLATEGLALVTEGEVEQGTRCLDEATAAALGGEYEELVGVGWTCCHLIVGPPKTRPAAAPSDYPPCRGRGVGRPPGNAGPPDAFVFTAPKGGPLWVIAFRARIWRPATRNAGLDGLRIHDLRHTAVALWIAAGANPKTRRNSVSFT